jgi:hypothetical protein
VLDRDFPPLQAGRRGLAQSSLQPAAWEAQDLTKRAYWKGRNVVAANHGTDPATGDDLFGPYVKYEVVADGGWAIKSTLAPAFGLPGGGVHAHANFEDLLEQGIVHGVRQTGAAPPRGQKPQANSSQKQMASS